MASRLTDEALARFRAQVVRAVAEGSGGDRQPANEVLDAIETYEAKIATLVDAVGDGRYYDESTLPVTINGVHYDGAWRCLCCDRPLWEPHTDDCALDAALTAAEHLLLDKEAPR